MWRGSLITLKDDSIWKIEERLKNTNPPVYKCLVVFQVPDDTPFTLVHKFNNEIKSTQAEYTDNNTRRAEAVHEAQLIPVDSDSYIADSEGYIGTFYKA